MSVILISKKMREKKKKDIGEVEANFGKTKDKQT